MKSLFKVVSILIVLALLAPFAQAQSKPQKGTTPKKAAKSKQTAKPELSTFGDQTVQMVEVLQVAQANAYTYVQIKTTAGHDYWTAIPKTDLEVGSKFSFVGAAKMSNFKSKDLNKTFDEVYFIGSIRKEGAELMEATVVPAIDPIPDSETHEVSVLEIIQANSYTYLKVEEGESVYWIAIQKREMEIGQKLSFGHALKMGNFKSKDLNKTFEDIYFIGRIKVEGEEELTMADVPGHENIDLENISVEPAEGGITIAEVFAGRADHAGKTIRVRGQVTKYSKNIMAMHWVHLKDGTGEEGTDDLTITTDETVVIGQVVTFEGTIVLNKDFGAGYKYDVIMQQAKKVE